MPDDELIDVFDAEMRPLGTALRGQAHREGLWHQTSHCWIVRRDATGDYLVFQRRGPDKDIFPNLLDVSAAGHIAAGEPLDVGGARELSEELGIELPFESLRPLGVLRSEGRFGGLIDREFNHLFLLRYDAALDQYRPLLPEVPALAQILLHDAARLFGGAAEAVAATEWRWGEGAPPQPIRHEVTLADIAPRPQGYYAGLLEQIAADLG